MHAEDLGALVAVRYDLGYVFERRGQHLLALGDRGRQQRGHAFADDIAHPVAQAFFLRIIGVKAIGAVAVDIDETGQDALAAVVPVRLTGAVRIDACNPAVSDFDLRRDKLVCQPDLFTLNDHFF